ncbi:MAG: hypothetical protein H8E44_28545 [Planctomycetes bacterium]|nr:hypothetical protein [Planctomycetota bacterium]MBL7042571.1 hypothetical protein [Pirellulaceae bacterium]
MMNTLSRVAAFRWHATLAIVGAAVLNCAVSSVMAGPSNSLMDISSDGSLLACANRDSGTVTIVNLDAHTKRNEVLVGAKPEGVSFIGATHEVAVAVYGEDKIVYVDADNGKTTGQTEVFDEPYGIVSNERGDRLYVTLDYPGQVVEIDVKTREVARQFSVGKFIRGIALAPDGRRAFLTEFYTAVVKAVDLATGKVSDEWHGASTDNLVRQIVSHPRRPKAYFAHMRSRATMSHGEGSIFPYVSVVDTDPGEGRRRKRIPMDSFLGNRVTANPWEVAVSADGRQFYVVFSGTDDMFACDVIDDNYREIALRGNLRLGHNPRAVRVAPDGETFYVYNALDFAVAAYDAQRLRLLATIPVCDNPLGEEVRQGKILFHSALQPMVGRRWISCSSCHPDGESDGRTWQKQEGQRDTPSLSGLAWTHPVLWSANRDEVQDWEHTIRGSLMQGRGLIRGDVQPVLGPPNKGHSADLDALAAYTNSQTFTLSPHAKGGLSDAANRGREILFSAKAGCVRCHKGPFYTDSAPRPPERIIRHNVGTGDDDPTETMGPAYDTPTLLGVYRTAPYLHHGKALTLKEVFSVYNSADRHGTTSHLTKSQIADLVVFLKSLPYEDPDSSATKVGLTKIVD